MKFFLTALMFSMVFIFGPKVKLLDSTSQEWAGGRYESGYGTNFKISLIAKGSNEKLQIDELWVGDRYFKVQALKSLAYRNDSIFAKGDTVYVRSSIKYIPGENGVMKEVNKLQKESPFEFSGDALLGYTWKGKKKFLVIKNIRKLEKIIYP